jgi:hypothetical protein
LARQAGRQADRQTEKTKLTDAFGNFVNAPKNWTSHRILCFKSVTGSGKKQLRILSKTLKLTSKGARNFAEALEVNLFKAFPYTDVENTVQLVSVYMTEFNTELQTRADK